MFDPDGAGGPRSAVSAATFQYLNGNAIAIGGNAAVANFINGVGPTTFTTDFQAKLGSITNIANVNQDLDQGFGTINNPSAAHPYQITVVAKITEHVVSATTLPGGGVALFKVTPSPAAGDFVKIYYNPIVTANDLTGTGFTDGTLIYQATTLATNKASDASFIVTGGGPGTPLDQHGTNKYPGIDTVTGGGHSSIDFVRVSYDPNFFVSPNFATYLGTNFGSDQELPFLDVDPSALFFDGHPGATLVNVGPVNGSLTVIGGVAVPSGPDFMFQTHAHQIFGVAAPSAVALSVVGAGVLGLVGLLRKRRRLAIPI
jgi:hypothetical protein